MKTFLKKLLLMALILAPLGLLYPLTIWKEWRCYLSSLKLDDQQSIIVCGHSLEEVALDPSFFPELANFSQSGCPLQISSLKIQDVIRVNGGRCKILLLDVNPVTCRAEENLEPWTFDSGYGFECLWWLHHPDQFRCLPWDYATRRMKNLFNRRSAMTGGFLKKYSQAFISEPERIRKFAENEVLRMNKRGPFTMDTWYFQELRRIITFTQSNGVKVVLLTTPLHKSVRDRLTNLDSFTAILRQLSTETHSPWLNYLSFDVPDTDWCDVNHLNCHGACQLTPQVKTDLRQAGLVSDYKNVM